MYVAIGPSWVSNGLEEGEEWVMVRNPELVVTATC